MVKEKQSDFSDLSISSQQIADLCDAMDTGKVSGKMAKDVQVACFDSQASVNDIIAQMGGGQISDTSELEMVVQDILKANMDVVEKIKAGKTNSANFLMGQVMKSTQGRAKPDVVLQLILDVVETL